MNKIFKLKWNHTSQSWIVCSELTKAKGKSKYYVSIFLVLGSLLSFSKQTIATECTNNNGIVNTNTTCEITGKKTVASVGWQSYLLARDGGKITVTGEGLDLDLTANSTKYNIFNSDGFNAQRNSKLTAKNLSVTLQSTPGKNVTMRGVVAFANSMISADTINAKIVYQNDIKTDHGAKESYGIQVGTAIKNEDTIADGQSKVSVRDANITITNTPTTTTESNRWWATAPYQLTGIRVVRNEAKIGSTPIFESTGEVVINAYDSSTNNSGDYVNGIYVSGPDSKVILNDSKITVGKSGKHSAALKIGKARSVGTGNGIVESKGQMILDTSAEDKAPTVRLVGSGSSLIANFENSRSEIKSANTAILFGGSDYFSSGSGKNQKVLLNNAVIGTTATEANLIQVNANTTGEFTLSGNKTEVSAAKNGWLINVENNSNLDISAKEGKMTGLVNKVDSSILNINLSDKFNWILREHTDTTKQAYFNKTNLSSGATITAAKQGTAKFILKGDVSSNEGIITTVDGKAGDILTIEGNYEGNNSLVRMDTIWNSLGDENGANSTSDILKITGSATGSTIVSPISHSGKSNIIEGNVKQLTKVINTIPVIEVATPGERAFSGTAQTRGGVEVQLAKKTEAGKDLYYWTMEAKSQPDTPTYNPIVSAYVQMHKVNIEQGYTSLRTLHERHGENQILAWDYYGDNNKQTQVQTWGKILGHHLAIQGKNRFGFSTNIYGFQLGHDFNIKRTDKGAYRLTGIYIAYNQANTKFTDLYRTENAEISNDKFTGKGKSKLFSLGITHTRHSLNGSYLDIVGQLSYLKNSYIPRDNNPTAKQHGYGLILSAEVGRPYSLTKHNNKEVGWLIEPQVQLIYQTIKLNKFNDGIRMVEQSREHNSRGRMGVRLAYNNKTKNYRTNTFYFIANLWSDLSKQQSVKIAQDSIATEKYRRFWGEIGLGMQIPVSKQTYLYSDARYEFQINTPKREGYHGTIGIKYTWK